MSESEAHKNLVVATASVIKRRYPRMSVQMDIQEAPGDPIPELFQGHRPDIVARAALPNMEMIIAEAKTRNDLDKHHTLNQVEAFVGHLQSRRHGVGTFILTVSGEDSSRDARNLLRYTFRSQVSSRLRVQLFDGLDFWTLGSPQEQLWRLS